MQKTVKKPRKGTKPNAPTVINIQINKSKIREVIGSGGKLLKIFVKNLMRKLKLMIMV